MTATEEQWANLRKPFDKDQIELLPKYTGNKGPDGRIPKETYKNCPECGRRHPFPCVHLNYVGHAGITERLNECDPEWNWEPAAFDPSGLPLMKDGGMWIKLTVFGVTRWGFGDAQGKTGPNAIKEIIGDAIRNAAMRFGVGTYLWSKSERAEHMLEFEEPKDEPSQQPAKSPGIDDLEHANAKNRCWRAVKAYAAAHNGDAEQMFKGIPTRPSFADTAEYWNFVAEEFESAAQ